MFLYESLIKSKYYKDITHEFIQREYNDNIELENKLNNISDKLNKTFSDQLLTLELCAEKDPILQKVLKRLNISIDYKSIAGNVLETIVVEYIKEYFNNDNINKWPNGEMNFPDFSFNNIPIDVKSVFVPEESACSYKFDKHGKKKFTQFHNAIESKSEVIKKLKSFFNGENKCNIGSAFILFVYYSCLDNGIKILGTQIVPLIITIKLKSDLSDFSIKSAGRPDENGNREPKNTNVNIGLTKSDNRTLDEIYNNLLNLINN